MKTMILAILIGTGLMAGCQTTAPGGLVTEAETRGDLAGRPRVGLEVPDVKFTNSEGKTRSLQPASGWMSLVGFVESKGKECCLLSPVLIEAASRYWNKPVRVIQVSLPTTDCPHGAGCVETCHVQSLHLMALCDSARVAYKAFGSPEDGTVLAIDGDGRITAIATVDKVQDLYPRVDRLAEKAKKKSLPTYVQIYLE